MNGNDESSTIALQVDTCPITNGCRRAAIASRGMDRSFCRRVLIRSVRQEDKDDEEGNPCNNRRTGSGGSGRGDHSDHAGRDSLALGIS
jgi:hypothetical protein